MRSFDRAMPEEINRVLTDHLSALLLCSSEVAAANLAAEGIGRTGAGWVGGSRSGSRAQRSRSSVT